MRSEWAVWMAVAFFALLPFRRLAEIPVSVFAFSLIFLASRPENRLLIRSASRFILPLFLCYWLPILFSSFDTAAAWKSWPNAATSIRFLPAALAVAVLLRPPAARNLLLLASTCVLLFWAVDGFVQLAFGSDLLGVPMHPDRLNALFNKKYQFYGPTLAMLSPLALEYARRHWRPWAWMATLGLILGAVLIAGMRAGWVIMAVVTGAYAVLAFRLGDRRLQRMLLAMPMICIGVFGAAYLASPLVQERIAVSRAFATGEHATIDESSVERLPIFSTALKMYRAHPVNGVGARAFAVAYPDYAAPGDIHVRKGGGKEGASHAHNVVLEVMADTGTIGLAGLLTAFVLAWRALRSASPGRRLEAFPFALAVFAILFPLNSHFAIFGVYTSSLIWMLTGLWGAALLGGAAPLESKD
jgi:O-antigen ligase